MQCFVRIINDYFAEKQEYSKKSLSEITDYIFIISHNVRRFRSCVSEKPNQLILRFGGFYTFFPKKSIEKFVGSLSVSLSSPSMLPSQNNFFCRTIIAQNTTNTEKP